MKVHIIQVTLHKTEWGSSLIATCSLILWRLYQSKRWIQRVWCHHKWYATRVRSYTLEQRQTITLTDCQTLSTTLKMLTGNLILISMMNWHLHFVFLLFFKEQFKRTANSAFKFLSSFSSYFVKISTNVLIALHKSETCFQTVNASFLWQYVVSHKHY